MHLLVIGAGSGIGKLTVERALERGHTVRALSRSGPDLPERPELEQVAADATDIEALHTPMAGVDAVILAVGLGKAAQRFWQPTTVFSEATIACLSAMGAAGVRRLLAVTGFGAGESAQAMSLIERTGHRVILGRAYADKDRQEELIQAADLDWTIVRPVILTDGPGTGHYKVLTDPKTWRNGLIARADVAHYLVHAAEDSLHLRQGVVLAR